ncbi:hypothetical protein KFK09_006426 [Dendrobium nobile]|uniref:Uncharacterized protein n=1 Tax=Dendrobium nobile TaxID=94219 RepID=A0A8T3BTG8_DENNO|nr:hypothetical protein KFK09_006426 [Dendrobium nobile]
MASSDLPIEFLHCIASQLRIVDYLQLFDAPPRGILFFPTMYPIEFNVIHHHGYYFPVKLERPPTHSPWLLLPSEAGET